MLTHGNRQASATTLVAGTSTSMYTRMFFGRQGSVAPVWHIMLATGALGYYLEYPHLIAGYKAKPPTWSKYYKAEESA
eukprot:m.270480 g.270480  ORF g.270480 m.270480 type:complete len:78 (-) comp19316_c0_seq1:273-506(-)